MPRERKSIRLRGFDYSSTAVYFVTICTYERQHLFGEIRDGEMHLNDFGNIVWWQWYKSEWVREEIHLAAFVIMPNHIHGIVYIAHQNAEIVGATGRSPLRQQTTEFKPGPAKRSLGAFVAGFKSGTTLRINKRRNSPGLEVWQRNYYERIIRDEDELNQIHDYIHHNPANWETDENR